VARVLGDLDEAALVVVAEVDERALVREAHEAPVHAAGAVERALAAVKAATRDAIAAGGNPREHVAPCADDVIAGAHAPDPHSPARRRDERASGRGPGGDPGRAAWDCRGGTRHVVSVQGSRRRHAQDTGI